jgi:hypothetical protein
VSGSTQAFMRGHCRFISLSRENARKIPASSELVSVMRVSYGSIADSPKGFSSRSFCRPALLNS